jgi:hypothetical protein
MRKTRRSRGRNAEFDMLHVTPLANQPTEFHIGEELTADQRESFRSLLYDDFPELMQPVDSPLVSRQWDHPVGTIGPMKRQRLNRLSHVERAELTRQLKDAMDVLFVPVIVSSTRQFFLCEMLMARFVCASTIVALTRLRIRTLTRFRVWTTPMTSLRTRTFTHTSTSPLVFGKFKCVILTLTRRLFRTLMA